MDVSIIGSGYVGTTVAACFADLGHEVVNVDIDEEVVKSINGGEASIHEPGLDNLVDEYGGDELRATTEYADILETDVTFLALPTPSRADGSIDTSIIEAAAETLGETLREKEGEHVAVTKSTVVPTTTRDVLAPIMAEASGKTRGEDLHVGMNPEFLREGTAVADFQSPDKLVFGTEEDDVALDVLYELYEPLREETDAPVVETGLSEAEMIKYANNGFLASKISLINDIGNICKEFGVDAYEVADAIGLDDRIGEQFLRSGVGWGGSCFPKDMNAIRRAAQESGYEPAMLDAAVEVNDEQPERLLALLDDHLDAEDERVTVLGLAFKPGTDDVRNTRAVPVVEGLVERGADVVAYDPVATKNAREILPNIEYVDAAADALDGASGALIVTDWDEFSALGAEFEAMERRVVIDGRHVDLPVEEYDLEYEGLCW